MLMVEWSSKLFRALGRERMAGNPNRLEANSCRRSAAKSAFELSTMFNWVWQLRWTKFRISVAIALIIQRLGGSMPTRLLLDKGRASSSSVLLPSSSMDPIEDEWRCLFVWCKAGCYAHIVAAIVSTDWLVVICFGRLPSLRWTGE
jgi:hypothetical protein